MKKVAWFITLSLSLSLLGCNKDAEMNAFIDELDAVTKELVETINADPTENGVVEAQKILDRKKKSLTTKLDGIKGAIGLQVGFGMRKKLEDSVANNIRAMMEISEKQGPKLAVEGDAAEKYDTLMADYQSIFAESKE